MNEEEYREALIQLLTRIAKANEDELTFMRERAAKSDLEDAEEEARDAAGGDSELLEQAIHRLERKFDVAIHPDPDDSEVKPV